MEEKTVSSKAYIIKISILVALLTSIFTGLAYNVFPVIQTIITKSEPTWTVGASNAGDLMSAMVLLFAGAGLIAGYYVDLIYKKTVAIIGGTLTGIFCIVSGTASTWELFFLSQIFIALGNGIISPVIFSLISDVTPPEKRSTNYGIVIFFGIIGGVVGVILFFSAFTTGEWRIPYVITGIMTISLALAIIVVKLPKRGSKEKVLEEVLQTEGVDYDYKIELKDIPVILKRKSNVILLLNFADALPSGVFLFAVPWLVYEHNVLESTAAIFAIFFLIFRFASPPIWGNLADKKLAKTQDPLSKLKFCLKLLITYSPLFIIAVLIPWVAPDGASLWDLLAMPTFVVFLITLLAAFFISSGTQPIWQSAISEINLPEHRATSYQLANFVDQVGIAIGAFVAGRLIDLFTTNGYTIAFIFAAIAGLVNIFTWVLALRYYKDDLEDVQTILANRAEELKKQIKE